jgi:small-conductance mechanosensitive channel
MDLQNQALFRPVCVLLIIIAGFFLQTWISSRVIGMARRYSVPISFAIALRVVTRWLVILLVLVISLRVLGIEMGNAWTLLSTILAMVAVGFVAVWSLLSNSLAFFVLIVWHHWRIGDTIQVLPENLRGSVEDMDLMFTRLRTDDGDIIVVPNNIFLQRFVKVEPTRRPQPISS